jgi:hypothetical protein
MSIMEGWKGKPEAKFVFQCKLYTDSMIKSTDPKIVQLLFIQVRNTASPVAMHFADGVHSGCNL